MAEHRDLVIDCSATFRLNLDYHDANDQPIDLTGWSSHWQARRTVDDAEALIDKTTTVAGSVITLYLSPAETAALSGKYVYAVEVRAPSGDPVIRLVQGTLTADPDVVR